MLRFLAARLDLPNVCFTGFLTDSQLAACYEKADAFVCASRHEGFCLPLIEAMHHDVPVLARQCGAMPETVGQSGVLFDETSPAELGELIYRVMTGAPLREEIIASQRARLAEIRNRDRVAECAGLLGRLFP
jgi:glycosyltransferase involved in cell wall biosynthesis